MQQLHCLLSLYSVGRFNEALEWAQGIRNYAETARSRGQIGTPSYSRVTEDLNAEASGRWTRYRDHLEAVLPELLPWAERMGYPGE